MNEIDHKCPDCSCKKADVLAIINDKLIYVRCLADDRKHNYTIDPKSDEQWKKFFKPEKVKEILEKNRNK